jgi:(1->4)-alpha-D-glucan 1-alpha-D-glucosylmutase
LRVHGSQAHHVCAFARRHNGSFLVTIAPRLYRRLLDDPERLPLGEAVWQDTLVELPRDQVRGALRSVLDDSEVLPVRYGGSGALPVAQALAQFPVALLTGRIGGDATLSTEPATPR